MSELIQLRQASGGVINVLHDVDGVPLDGITSAKYQLFKGDADVVLTSTLGAGISWVNGQVAITITAQQAAALSGHYTHECAVKDLQGRDLFVLSGPIRFIPTKVRI